MGSIRFYAFRLEPRWLLLAAIVAIAATAAALSLKGTPAPPPPPLAP